MDVYVYAYDRTTVWRNFLFVRMNSMAMEIANCKKKNKKRRQTKIVLLCIYLKKKKYILVMKRQCAEIMAEASNIEIFRRLNSAHTKV